MDPDTLHSTSDIYMLNYTTYIYMISETIEYVNRLIEETKQQHNNVNDVILKSALVYQYLYLNHYDTMLSIDDILELNNNEIGLIGPGNGCLTHFFEKILGQSDILHSHSILHDAFWSILCPSFIRQRLHICYT